MGLTDAPEQRNIQDVYPEGTPFVVTQAWVEGVVKTQYGDRTMGKVVIQPVGAPAGSSEEFSVWGSLCEQVQQVDPSELPLIVTIRKDGRRHLFVAAEQEAADVLAGTPQAPAPAPPASQPPLPPAA